MKAKATRPRGFTLIEVMTVVGIVGILSTIALPEYRRISLRPKTTERPLIMARLKQAVQDRYLAQGQIATYTTQEWSNATDPTGQKRVPDWNGGNWAQLVKNGEIEGALYYNYFVLTAAGSGGACTAASIANCPRVTISAWGDLDGDGVPSLKVMDYRQLEGGLVLQSEVPAAGEEDKATF